MRSLKPSSILDLGTGFGKWGVLFREYTDIIASEHEPSRYGRENWRVRIDGVEGYTEYITPVHKYVYNELFQGDIRDVLPGLGKYDIVFLGDVIEHFEKADGVDLLLECTRHASTAVVVSTPATFVAQGAACSNDLEIHRSHWTERDFEGFGGKAAVVENDLLVACLPSPGVESPPISSMRPSPRGPLSLLKQIARRVVGA
ncbi:MAG: class I SAM-dependent methyltransferase [Planctomycetota bacterium]